MSNYIAMSWAVRDKNWIEENLSRILIDIKHQDQDNIEHINTCDGCEWCDHLMEFYSGCENCSITAHKSRLFYIENDGYYLCEKCL